MASNYSNWVEAAQEQEQALAVQVCVKAIV